MNIEEIARIIKVTIAEAKVAFGEFQMCHSTRNRTLIETIDTLEVRYNELRKER